MDMNNVLKKGANLLIIFQFEDDEWNLFHPQDFILGSASCNEQKYDLNVNVDNVKKSVIVSGNTTDWKLGYYKADVTCSRGGIKTFLPPVGYIEFELEESISGE